MKTSKLTGRLLFYTCAFICLFQVAAQGAIQQEYWVSPSGSDINAGTLAAPFRTVDKARLAVRANLTNMTGDIVVYLRAGDYHIPAGVTFGNADSGTNGFRVIYKNWDALGSARIISAARLSGWSADPADLNVWTKNVGANRTFSTILEGENQGITARYPNKNVTTNFPSSLGDYLIAESGSFTNLQYASGDLDPATWTAMSDPKLCIWGASGVQDWGLNIWSISSIDSTNRMVYATGSNTYAAASADRYYVQGVLEFLDATGEFYYDKTSGLLKYRPFSGQNPGNNVIIPGSASVAFRVQGSAIGNLARNIRFEGLYFWGSLSYGFYLTHTENIEIINCHFKFSGREAIMMKDDNQNNLVSGCWIEHSGYGGIYIFNALDRTTNAANKSSGHIIENCKIHDLTDVMCSSTENGGVNIWNANNCTVSHCEIFNGARYAISLRGHYSTESEPYDNGRHYSISNVFEELTIHNVGSDSGDMGAIHAAAVNPTGSPYINYWRNIEVDDITAAPTMHDIAPNGIFLDHAHSCENQSFENIRIRNTQGLPYRDNVNPVQSFSNCSWIAGFNESLMSTSMGLTEDFPVFDEGPFLPPAALPTTTLAYWQLDEASGAWIIQDAIGSNDLTLSVSATQTLPSSAITDIPTPDLGPFNIGDTQDNPAALNSSHAARPAYDEAFDMRSASWTLEGWFRHSPQTTAEVLAGTRNSSSGYKGWDLTMTNGALKLAASPTAGDAVSITTPSRYDDGAWHHTAVQWEPAAGSNGWMRIYVDGTLVQEGAGAGDLGNTDSTKRFALGGQIATDGTVASAWTGDLDEFRFSGMLLVPADFLCTAAPATTTVAYWQMDDATGSSFIQDAVGSHHLTMGVGITQTEPSASIANIPNPDTSRFRVGDPEINPAAFNNSCGGQASYDATFDMRTAPWTLEGWIRNSLTNTQLIAATRNSSAGFKGWDLSMINGNLRVLANSDIAGSTSFTTTGKYNDGVWHHVAVRWDPTNGVLGKMRLYVDGAMVKEGSGVGDLGNTNSTKRFALGCQMLVDGTASSPWLGDLDEFRFSSTLLEPTNFLNMVNAPLTVTINQAAGQADPAGAEPVNFAVEFSTPVTDFVTGDVTISGTAPGTKTAAVSGSGTSYTVAVTGMSGSGTVIATVETNKAHSAAGSANVASTSTDNTVTFSYTPPVPTTTVAYWQLDETTGSTVLQDAIGTNNLTLSVKATNTTPFKAKVPRPDAGPFSIGDPKTNPAALTGSYGALPAYDATFDMRSSPWTLEGWFRNTTNNVAQMIVATRNSPTWKGWDLRMQANGTIYLFAQPSSGTATSLTTTVRYDDGVWHHMAVQWDPNTGTKGRIRLYMDGALAKECGGAGDLGSTNVTLRFSIGAQIRATGQADSPWKGDLDEFRFSNALLDPTNFLYAPATAPATLAYWQLDETTGASVLQDAVGTNNLTVGVAATNILPYSFITNIPNPDAGPFTVGDPKTNPAALNNSHGGRTIYDEKFDMRDVPWTLEGWFRNTEQTVAGVLAGTRNSPGWKGWDLTMMSNGTLRVLTAADITTSSSTFYTEGRYDDGAWHHMALRWDPDTGSKGWIQLYVDGNLAVEDDGAGDLGNTNSTKRFAIGAQVTAAARVDSPWKGDLDEFRFSNHLVDPANFLNVVQAPPPPEGAVVWNLSADCRNGQTFIQWNEVATNSQNFKVYMHTEPITSANFAQAQLVEQRIEPHSANDWYEDTNECPLATGPARGWILQDGGTAAGRTGGLFVHTVVESDPAQAFFAVLADSQSAADIAAGHNSLTTSVDMAVAPIRAIWQLGAPTANSPPAAGKPLAMYLHSHQSRPSGSLTYLIFGDKTMGWREGLPFKFKVSVLTNAVKVEPYNRIWINRKLGAGESLSSYDLNYKNIETMHYGASDKIYDPVERYNGTLVNYTERLYLKMLDWVEQTYQTDTNKVYAYGDSMGTGILRLALQNPDRFASVDLLVPFVDWSYVNGSESNAKRMLAACGPMTMMTSDGVALSNRMNLVEQVQNTTHDLPHITIRVGRTDGSVYWARKPVYMGAMQTNRHGLIAGWDNGDHSTAMRTANIAGFPNHNDYTYYSSHFARNKSYPAFTRFSMNQNPGNGDKTDGDITGFINRGLEWSNIVDQVNTYAVKVQVTHPDAVYPVTVDVTPRNLQNLQLTPGQTLRMQNRNSAGTVVEEKTVTVDPAGLLTYEAFTIDSAQGNTLTADATVYYTLTSSAGVNGTVSPASTNVPSGGSADFVIIASNYYRIASLTTNETAVDGASFGNSSTSASFTWTNVQAAGALAATFTAQTAADPAGTPYPWMAQYGLTNFDADAVADTDLDGLKTWQEYIAGTNPTNATSGLKVTQSPSRNTISWNAVSGRVYSVYWSTNLVSGFQSLNTNIQYPQSSYTNASPNPKVNHYQIKVRMQ